MPLPSVAPGSITIYIGLETKSTFDPMYKYVSDVKFHQVKAYIPLAKIGDCKPGDTNTEIGALDVPPITLTATSINPDNNVPLNCPDTNSTINTRLKSSVMLIQHLYACTV